MVYCLVLALFFTIFIIYFVCYTLTGGFVLSTVIVCAGGIKWDIYPIHHIVAPSQHRLTWGICGCQLTT